MVAMYTVSLGTLGSVASLFVATLYQGNIDRNHKLWNDIPYTVSGTRTSIEIYKAVSHTCKKCAIINKVWKWFSDRSQFNVNYW
jgi:hypothetical protein